MQRRTGFFSLRFEDSIFIDAPPERGFAFFEAMDENYLRWHPDHLGFEWRKGRGIRPGTVFWFRERIGGKVMEKEVRIDEVTPDRFYAFAPTSRLMRAFLPRMSFAFRAEGGGFHFEAVVHLRGVGPMGQRLNRRDFAAVEQHMAEEGRNLKAILEAGAAGAGN